MHPPGLSVGTPNRGSWKAECGWEAAGVTPARPGEGRLGRTVSCHLCTLVFSLQMVLIYEVLQAHQGHVDHQVSVLREGKIGAHSPE